MIILFPKRKGVKIATAIIFRAIERKAGFNYIMGMLEFAHEFGAITGAERATLTQYLVESYKD